MFAKVIRFPGFNGGVSVIITYSCRFSAQPGNALERAALHGIAERHGDSVIALDPRFDLVLLSW
jgi:hypothetical protein